MKRNLKPSGFEVEKFQEALLGWYDRHGRDIPWRYKGGAKADPYRVWLSEIMCQQTTVPAVIPYFLKFTSLWPDVRALAKAPVEDVMREWAGLGYYARARNLHKCAQLIVSDYGGVFPQTPEELKKLPGIGDYTAAAIAAIAFNISSPVVDGNVERVLTRIFAVEEPLPAAKAALKKLAVPFFETGFERPGDLAQAFMDLGSGPCIPNNPRCELCPVSGFCKGHEMGIQAGLPRKSPKALKPQKVGYVYLVRDGAGHVVLERRPDKAMMGGMSAFPTSSWEESADIARVAHPLYLDISAPPTTFIRHSFTHFDLQLWLVDARVAKELPEGFYTVRPEALDGQGFPTLFKKAYRLWRSELMDERPRKAV